MMPKNTLAFLQSLHKRNDTAVMVCSSLIGLAIYNSDVAPYAIYTIRHLTAHFLTKLEGLLVKQTSARSSTMPSSRSYQLFSRAG